MPISRLALVSTLAALAYGLWLRETRLPLRGTGIPPIAFTVTPGATAESIGEQLRDLGLLRHPVVLRALVWLQGSGTKLRAGDYAIDGPMTLKDIVEMLVRGETARRGVTFPEGKTLREMARVVDAAGLRPTTFLDVASDPSPVRDLDPAATSLEGYLFPDTYQVSTYVPEPEKALVNRMVQRFREVIAPEREAIVQSRRSLREIVILASLVELETASRSERPRIAAVFLNRLARKMPLQTDPTIIYALREEGRYDGNIRKQDLSIDSPYNTYTRQGIPPGPIGSPGIEAIRAVLRPAQSDAIYFVSRNDGTHVFSRTLAEHNRAVNLYQRAESPSPTPSEGASSEGSTVSDTGVVPGSAPAATGTPASAGTPSPAATQKPAPSPAPSLPPSASPSPQT